MALTLRRDGWLPDRRKANKAEAAEFFGVTPAAIDKWLRRGCPSIQTGALNRQWILDLLEVAKWRYGAREAADDGGFDPDQASPKDRKDWFDSEFRRRQLQERDRELIPAGEVEAGLAALIQQTVRTLDTLGDVLERDCGISGQVVERIHKATDAAREELYQRVKDGLPT